MNPKGLYLGAEWNSRFLSMHDLLLWSPPADRCEPFGAV